MMVNPLYDIPILGSLNSAAYKDMKYMAKWG